VLCQYCGTANPRGRDLCQRCGNKLLVVSGPPDESADLADDTLWQAQEELEEHLLERITGLEDGVRQLSGALQSMVEHLSQLEHNLTVTHAGVQSLGNLLQSQGIVSRAEVVDGWERSVGQELLSRDLSRRFEERAQRILSLAAHSGHATAEFRRRLRALRLAVLGPDTESAQQLLADLARLAPGNDELWSLIGEVAFSTGDLESAQVAFERVLNLRGPHFETLVYLGTVTSDLSHWPEAERHLLAARDMAPDAFLPHFALGALAVLRGEHGAAVPHLAACLERDEVPQALYLLGLAHLQLRHKGRAIEALRRAVELEPDFEDALYQLGIAYLRRGWSRLALDAFQQVLRLDPQRLQYQETVRLLRLSPRSGLPREVSQLVQRAEAALEEGRTEVAFQLFTSAVATAPDQPGLQATSALLASALGHTREAVGYAHRLLRQRPHDSPYLAAAVVAVLEALRQAGRLLAARRLAQRLFLDEQDQLARGMAAYELALVESELGQDLDSARDLAREALEITPRELRHYPLAALGAIALKRGRFREATQYLEQAAATAPQPLLLRQLAVARLGAGDAQGAEAALKAAEREPTGGLDEELLGHVRRLGTLVEGLNRRHRALAGGQAQPGARR
jgi:tetratricopeptide (TPR) repeat protein